RTRFEDRLSFKFEVDPSLASSRVPPMILQPLVENAVRHGISPRREGGSVHISARTADRRIVISVEDTGAGLKANSAAERPRGHGIGVANVRERLAHVYGETAELRLESSSAGGTRAVLALPHNAAVHA